MSSALIHVRSEALRSEREVRIFTVPPQESDEARAGCSGCERRPVPPAGVGLLEAEDLTCEATTVTGLGYQTAEQGLAA